MQIASRVGAKLKGGEVIQLVGDLGAGKTAFVKGLAKGMGSEDEVASPTFTISRIYDCANDIQLCHYDFYRLDDPGIMASEIEDLARDPKSVIAIEWSDIVKDVLPEDSIIVTFAATSEESRKIAIAATEKYL